MSYLFFPSPTPVFPVLPTLTWSVRKKPLMASRVARAASGREVQLAGAVYPRWAFVLSYGGNSWLRDQTQNITPDPRLAGKTELMQISELFLSCLGAYGEFYYSDPDDSSRSGQFVGNGNASQISFPLYYSWGNGPFSPNMNIPVGGVQSIDAVYFSGVLQSPTLYYLDSTNTILLFHSAPPNGSVITVDFHFYFRCRFLDDHMDYSQWARNLWEVKEVKFESVKP